MRGAGKTRRQGRRPNIGTDTKRACLIAKVAFAAASKLFISSSLAFLGATTFATCRNDVGR